MAPRPALRRGSRRWWYYALEDQQDYSVGMVRSVARQLIDERGCYDLVNGLLDDIGSIYRRGGSVYQSDAAFGAQVRLVWDGWLAGGYRTFLASDAGFGVLAANDTTVVNLGGAGVSGPTGLAVVKDILYLDGGTMYAGSRKTTDYSTGTITTTAGGAVVTGAGTLWSANADAGMILEVAGRPQIPVKSVDSNTQITLNEPFPATLAGSAYALRVLTTQQGFTLNFVWAAANRLVTSDGNKVRFTAYGDPHTRDLTDFHELPDGVQILGGAGIGDSSLVFSTGGVWSIANLELALTDPAGNPQQRLALVNPEAVLWHRAGIAAWGDALVVPCLDGVYLMDAASQPQLLTRSIAPLYQGYVRAGYLPGRASVYRSHLFLPILSGSTWVDLLVCRLDRPIATSIGTMYGWTRFNGHGGKLTSLTQRTRGAAPKLLAGGTDGRVLDVAKAFEPDASVKNDADGTTHDWDMTTRDFATGYGNLNHVRKVTIRYELDDAAADNPTILGFISKGSRVSGTRWGVFHWGVGHWMSAGFDEFEQLSGPAPEETDRERWAWVVAKHTRYVRLRFKSSGPSSTLRFRSLELANRQAGSDT